MFLFISITISSCNLFGPGPNPPFYCKINGKNFTPESSSSSATVESNSLQMSWNENSGGISIRARNKPFEIFIIVLFDNKIIIEGVFNPALNSKTCKVYLTPNAGNSSPNDLTANSGIVEITKKDGYLLSGTFEFKAYDTLNRKEYVITKGEFNNLSYY